MEKTRDYKGLTHVTPRITVKLANKLDDMLYSLMKGTGWGEVTIVVEGHKIKWISLKESEPAINK
jgi:hypothetical protein